MLLRFSGRVAFEFVGFTGFAGLLREDEDARPGVVGFCNDNTIFFLPSISELWLQSCVLRNSHGDLGFAGAFGKWKRKAGSEPL